MPTPFKILFLRSGGYFADIEPPDAPMIAPPKGILYLAGLFKNDPHVKTEFLDILLHADLKAVRKERKNPPVWFGMKEEDVISRICESKPDMVAVTASANYYSNDTVKLINLVSRHLGSAFLVLGGPDATTDYEEYFRRCPGLSAVVMREGEIPFRNLVLALRENKPWKDLRGLAFKDEAGAVTVNPPEPYCTDLDSLVCDWDLVNLEDYFAVARNGFPSRLICSYPNSWRSIDLVTSRGCPETCSFCCIHLHMGRTFRARSAANVIEEMRMLIEQHDVRNFHFEDDTLLCDRERFKDILRGIIAHGWSITWDTPNGVRADHIDEELLVLCRQSGCAYLSFGVESGSKKVLDTIVGKNLDLEQIVRACRLCHEYEIDTLAFFIFGLPGETRADLLKTYYFAFDLFKKYNTTPMFQLWRPYRNTALEKAVRNTANITRPVIFSLHDEFEIPYTLFYSRVYEDEEVSVEFLSYYFKKYLRDVSRIAFVNWLRISARRPLMLTVSFTRILWIFFTALFSPSSLRSRLAQFMTSPGILPWAMVHKLGKKRKKSPKSHKS